VVASKDPMSSCVSQSVMHATCIRFRKHCKKGVFAHGPKYNKGSCSYNTSVYSSTVAKSLQKPGVLLFAVNTLNDEKGHCLEAPLFPENPDILLRWAPVTPPWY
jgi:hypothetical protein